MPLSDYGENLALDLLLGDGVQPDPVYIGLVHTEPDDTDTGSTLDEPSGGSYARIAVTNNATEWPAASGALKSNANDITFPTATADWGTTPLAWAVVVDALSGGNLIGWAKLNTSRTVLTGDTAIIKATNMSLTTAD